MRFSNFVTSFIQYASLEFVEFNQRFSQDEAKLPSPRDCTFIHAATLPVQRISTSASEEKAQERIVLPVDDLLER
jgi:hypothetical protein